MVVTMIESGCGLRCVECGFRGAKGCKGCVNMAESDNGTRIRQCKKWYKENGFE